MFHHTWSGSGLIHHDCGEWHDLAKVDCGKSWLNSCQIDARHGQGVATTIYGYDFELSMPYPTEDKMPKPHVVGAFDVEASFSGQASASKWTQLSGGAGIGFSFHDYEIYAVGTKLQVRACAVFTDSSSGKGVFKVQLVNSKGNVLFADDFGATWSGSGLIHHECGVWHDAPTECGYGTTTSCNLKMVHTQGVKTTVWDYDLEVGSSSTKSPFYAGRFHVPLPAARSWTGARSRVLVHCVWLCARVHMFRDEVCVSLSVWCVRVWLCVCARHKNLKAASDCCDVAVCSLVCALRRQDN